MRMRLDDDVVRGMELGRLHRNLAAPLNSIAFHRTDDVMLAANEEEMHVLIQDTGEAPPPRPYPLKCGKYGVGSAVWTHDSASVLHTSAKRPAAAAQSEAGGHAVRHLDVVRNQYISYFEGHTARVTGLEMSPKSDAFLSSGMDRTVRLWDVRTPACQGILCTPGPAAAAFDQQGVVFAVGADGGVIKLYDAAQYAKGPFEAFTVPELLNQPISFHQLSFSNDGNTLVAVAGGTAYVLDAFQGALQHAIRLGTPDGFQPQVSISYDSAYLISACDSSGAVGAWSLATGRPVATWRAAAADSAPRAVAWAPRRLMAASGAMALALWIPGRAALERFERGEQQPP